MLVKKEKLMAQTTTKHCLGLFHGPFDSFSGVDGVGSGAVVILVNNVSIIIIKNMIKNIPGAASRAPVVVVVVVVIGVPFLSLSLPLTGPSFRYFEVVVAVAW